MNFIEVMVESVLSVPAGTRLKLSKDQIRRRARLLQNEGDVHWSESELQFKVGEVLEVEEGAINLFPEIMLKRKQEKKAAKKKAASKK